MNIPVLALFVFTGCGVLAAQSSTPAVVFRENCKNAADIPNYRAWFERTPLSHGEAYSVPNKQRQHIQEEYPKLRLQMSLAEVEQLLGSPDFSKPLPPARLETDPAPSEQECSNQLAYVLKKNGENMVDMADVAIYLFFSEDDRLYWAVPQNLPSLTPLGSPTEGNPRQSHVVSWKEYTFAADGFAITFPESPHTNSGTALPEMTVYTVSVLPDSKMHLQVSHQSRDCVATLEQLRDGALHGKSGTDPTSVKEVSIDGHPGLEYQHGKGAVRSFSDRLYCVDGRFFWFSSDWPSAQPRPAALDRIISSFRLLGTSTHN